MISTPSFESLLYNKQKTVSYIRHLVIITTTPLLIWSLHPAPSAKVEVWIALHFHFRSPINHHLCIVHASSIYINTIYFLLLLSWIIFLTKPNYRFLFSSCYNILLLLHYIKAPPIHAHPIQPFSFQSGQQLYRKKIINKFHRISIRSKIEKVTVERPFYKNLSFDLHSMWKQKDNRNSDLNSF